MRQRTWSCDSKKEKRRRRRRRRECHSIQTPDTETELTVGVFVTEAQTGIFRYRAVTLTFFVKLYL